VNPQKRRRLPANGPGKPRHKGNNKQRGPAVNQTRKTRVRPAGCTREKGRSDGTMAKQDHAARTRTPQNVKTPVGDGGQTTAGLALGEQREDSTQIRKGGANVTAVKKSRKTKKKNPKPRNIPKTKTVVGGRRRGNAERRPKKGGGRVVQKKETGREGETLGGRQTSKPRVLAPKKLRAGGNGCLGLQEDVNASDKGGPEANKITKLEKKTLG